MFARFSAGSVVLALAAIGVAGGTADASAQQPQRGLEMPANMQRPVQAPTDITPPYLQVASPAVPPGLSRLLGAPAEERDPTPIASSSTAPAPRLTTLDVYNNLTRSTLDQFKQGQFPTGAPGDRLVGENRWVMPPAVGVVIQRPVGRVNVNGASPATIGLNAGPSLDPYGTPGMAVNARVRVPFGH